MDYERRIYYESYILNEIYNKNPNKGYLKRKKSLNMKKQSIRCWKY